MAKEINKEQQEGKNLGLSKRRSCLYDALADHEKAVQELGKKSYISSLL